MGRSGLAAGRSTGLPGRIPASRFAINIPFRLTVAKTSIKNVLTKFNPLPADGVGKIENYIKFILKHLGIFGAMENFQGNQPGQNNGGVQLAYQRLHHGQQAGHGVDGGDIAVAQGG